MRSVSDDELYSVQGRYLGPPGHTIPWQARYTAYLLWAGFFLAGLILRAQLRLFTGGAGFLVVAVAATLATILTMRLVTPERPASAVATMLWAELGTPRPGVGHVERAAPTLQRVVVTAHRPRPRTRRGRR